MIYPNNYEHKIGFNEIRTLLKERCLSTLGREKVDSLVFSTQHDEVTEWLEQVHEFRLLQETADDFPLQYFFDVREAVARIRLAGTHLEENEVFDLRRSLDTIVRIVAYLNRGQQADDAEFEPQYPALHRLTKDVITFPAMIRRIDSILDKYGHVKDGASMVLAGIRNELSKTEGSISRTLYTILHSAQREGLVDKDTAPTMRDGRLMIPVSPSVKRRINGIVHDESATGKTVFIEPAEVVEANNRIRELEAEERREIIRILTVFSDEVRPHVKNILDSYDFLATIDLIRAKAELAKTIKAIEPKVEPRPHLDWIHAVHPLLALSLEKQQKKVVPLDITLSTPRAQLLIISGPNAGGKSVCLKTVGLLQYMLQCGLSVPMGDRSTCGIFQNIMIDIGDEQSIEDDLSTYSSHLMNMKMMIRHADAHTLLLIDEFGGGTEPTIGGAIAEAVLKQFWLKKTFGVITTHYQNLKHFAEDHEGVVNGAMLYDRHEMQALFQLSIGQPGSSFAIEIARKTGLPEEVINDAADIVGRDYIQSDKYLQDIVRDKRYWEGKRQTIHQHEKSLENKINRYEDELTEIEQQRKDILRRAKEQAEELLRESNRKIENAIREIREQQAEKEAAKRIREELDVFKQEVSEIDTKASDEMIERKMRQIQERKKRKEEKRKNLALNPSPKENGTDGSSDSSHSTLNGRADGGEALTVGATVRIKGLTSVGRIESIDGKMATVIFGSMRTKMRTDRLEPAKEPKAEQTKAEERNAQLVGSYANLSNGTRAAIDQRRTNFHQDIDVRGMRGDEAINAITYFIDDAILVGMSRVRILHGTGTGILRQLIRQYLATVPNVAHFRDEHVQFGGAGITVVDIE
ncbi:MAG: Smr/MutS family protein [Prevotella sp.]|jgi:DNA mismatch repair protein MutS2|nr:Smr/MutS family protein [Prevotella sp.]